MGVLAHAAFAAVRRSGYQISVPLFINIGDKIRVDTRDGSYMSRA